MLKKKSNRNILECDFVMDSEIDIITENTNLKSSDSENSVKLESIVLTILEKLDEPCI